MDPVLLSLWAFVAVAVAGLLVAIVVIWAGWWFSPEQRSIRRVRKWAPQAVRG